MKHFIKKGLVASVLAGVAALGATSSFAGTATANFQVTATVSSACTVSATNVNFGTITPAQTGTATATGTITSTCTKSTPYTLNINAGSGSFASRQMAGAISGNTGKLAYNLYTTNAYATIFGDGTASTANVALTGTGAAQATTVFGQLALNQYLQPDTYSDNLTVTLSY